MNVKLEKLKSVATTAATRATEVVRNQVAPAIGEHLPTSKQDLFDAAQQLRTAATDAAARVPKRPFAMGRDAYVAIDPQGRLLDGEEVMARTRVMKSVGLEPLLRILADSVSRDVSFTLPNGETLASKTDANGQEALPTDALHRGIGGAVNPKVGGMVQVGISTSGGPGDTANVLVLPRDYSGPIFVCDIDDTLRDTSYTDMMRGKLQPPVDGAKTVLDTVAGLNVPIIYLSSASDRLRTNNEEFLAQLPRGVFIDKAHLGFEDIFPDTKVRAEHHAIHKAEAIAQMQKTFPQAKFFALGDDKYGDAIAYDKSNVRSFILDVVPGDKNIPADFKGELIKSYSPEFIAKLAAELKHAAAELESPPAV